MVTRQTLPTRQLGKNGPQIPGMGFGLMELSVGYGTTPPSAPYVCTYR